MNRHVTIRRVAVVSIVTALTTLLAGSAEAGDRNWSFRFMLAAATSDSAYVRLPIDNGHLGAHIAGGGGVGINFEYRYAPRGGFEMGMLAMAGNIGVHFDKGYIHPFPQVDVGGYVPLTFAWNYHPLGKTGFDLYLGPFLASTIYSRVGTHGPWYHDSLVEAGVDVGVGFNLGADINLGKGRWFLNPGLKFIVTSLNNTRNLEFDPLILTFGAGIRF